VDQALEVLFVVDERLELDMNFKGFLLRWHIENTLGTEATEGSNPL